MTITKAPDYEKVKALQSRILEECKKQDFTVYEFEQLIIKLKHALDERRNKTYGETF